MYNSHTKLTSPTHTHTHTHTHLHSHTSTHAHNSRSRIGPPPPSQRPGWSNYPPQMPGAPSSLTDYQLLWHLHHQEPTMKKRHTQHECMYPPGEVFSMHTSAELYHMGSRRHRRQYTTRGSQGWATYPVYLSSTSTSKLKMMRSTNLLIEEVRILLDIIGKKIGLRPHQENIAV